MLNRVSGTSVVCRKSNHRFSYGFLGPMKRSVKYYKPTVVLTRVGNVILRQVRQSDGRTQGFPLLARLLTVRARCKLALVYRAVPLLSLRHCFLSIVFLLVRDPCSSEHS